MILFLFLQFKATFDQEPISMSQNIHILFFQ